MNKFIRSLAVLPILAMALGSCEKEENKVFFEGGSEPVLTTTTTAVALDPAKESENAITFKWSNPNYQFTTGISSQDVNYLLEFDVAGSNFTGKNKYTTNISRELERSFTVLELNSILGNTMLLEFGKQHSVEARITSSLGSNAVPLVSNKVTFTTTPYAPPPKVEPPATGNLWVTGDAFASSWTDNISPAYDATQKFTKVSNTKYELVVDFKGGGAYKLLQENSWGSQYHMLQGTWESGSIRKRDSDPGFPGAPTAGRYKITVDFQLGTFTVIKQ